MRTTAYPSLLSSASALALLGAMFSVHTSAMSLRELQALGMTSQTGESHASYYLVGVMEGALEVHLQAVRRGAKATICLKGRSLEPHMARDLYVAERLRNPDVYEADMPVALVMAHALTHAYPC